MRIIGKKKLEKYKRKNKGNKILTLEIERFIDTIELNQFENIEYLKLKRKDADIVHLDGFLFFDLELHRTLVLIEFEFNEATIVWVGNHQDYEKVFKNNKNVIQKWLKSNDWI
jgi:mRNA-degrading endonuclease HigB of HigAB toxin-antitoxin module